MKLSCRMGWKTNKLNYFRPVVIVRAVSWIPHTAAMAREWARVPPPR